MCGELTRGEKMRSRDWKACEDNYLVRSKADRVGRHDKWHVYKMEDEIDLRG